MTGEDKGALLILVTAK